MAHHAEIECRLVKELPEAELAALYRDAGWLQPGDDVSFLTPMLHGSLLCAAAFADGRLVGCARVMGDGVSDCCIQDVAVATAFRRRGIATALLKLLLAELQKTSTDFIQLIAEPDAVPLYRKLGFVPMPGCVPMKYAGAKQP